MKNNPISAGSDLDNRALALSDSMDAKLESDEAQYQRALSYFIKHLNPEASSDSADVPTKMTAVGLMALASRKAAIAALQMGVSYDTASDVCDAMIAAHIRNKEIENGVKYGIQ